MDQSTNQAPNDDSQDPQPMTPGPAPTAARNEEDQQPIVGFENLQISNPCNPQQEHESNDQDETSDSSSANSETNSLDTLLRPLPSVDVSWPTHPYAQELGQSLISLTMRVLGYDDPEQARSELMEAWGQYRALPSRDTQPEEYRDGMQRLVERMKREVFVRLMVFDRVCEQIDFWIVFLGAVDGQWEGEERRDLLLMGL